MQEYIPSPKTIGLSLSLAGISAYGARKFFSGGKNTHSADLTGKFVIVTGGTDGIGLEAAKHFASLGARVLITGRSREKADKFLSSLPTTSSITFQKIDFCDLQNIKRFAEKVILEEEKIDILVNNAGLQSQQFKKSAQDIEFTIAVNHLAPFYLTSLLLPKIKLAEKARIINVASLGHHDAQLNFDSMFEHNTRADYYWYYAYCDSKLANILFTKKLS